MCQTAFHHWLNCVITSPSAYKCVFVEEWLGKGSARTLLRSSSRVLKSYRTLAGLYTDPGQKLSAQRLKLTVSDRNSMGPGEQRYCANDIICILVRAFQNSLFLSLVTLSSLSNQYQLRSQWPECMRRPGRVSEERESEIHWPSLIPSVTHFKRQKGQDMKRGDRYGRMSGTNEWINKKSSSL